MAGPDPRGRFTADKVREKLRFAVEMGLPQDPTNRPTFYFDPPEVSGPTDGNGRPWDPQTATPVSPPTPPKQVACTIEVREGEKDETRFGPFEAQELVLGFFEDEWAEIEGWTRVAIDGRWYRRSYPLTVTTLFDLSFRQVRVEAMDM